MKTNEIQWQGDVGLEPIKNIPQDAKEIKGLTLALGEATGHHHSFRQGSSIQLFEDADKNKYAKVMQESILEHQEHDKLIVQPKTYKVIMQRVFDVQKGIQKVMD